MRIEQENNQSGRTSFYLLLGFLLAIHTAGFGQNVPKRIITLSGAITETVAALGYGSHIVATDVTSIYPAFVNKLPRVSGNRQLSPEGLLSFLPDLVLAPEVDITKEIRYQLKAAGVQLVTFNQQYSVKGTLDFIVQVGKAVGNPKKAEQLALQTKARTEQALAKVKLQKKKPCKVLFIYARGAGTMSVAGRGSSLDAIIQLAGGINAVKEFTDFKPYSTETMVKTNPDVILMFDFGVSSMGGTGGIMDLPGVSGTNAGKNKRLVAMNGQLLINFSTRLPDAIEALHAKLYN